MATAAEAAAARIARNRDRKARRFVDRFIGQMRSTGVLYPERDKAALQTALELVRSASKEQWEQVAREMTKDNDRAGIRFKEDVPSPATVVIIAEQFEAMIRLADAAKAEFQRDLDDVMEGLQEERRARLEERGFGEGLS
jgi:hypothetical protein